jgi:predicted dinucleotide-binding enzyme
MVEIGHAVILGTHEPDKFMDWQRQAGENARTGSPAEAAAYSEILSSTIKVSATLSTLAQAGEVNLCGKVLINVSTSLMMSQGTMLFNIKILR